MPFLGNLSLYTVDATGEFIFNFLRAQGQSSTAQKSSKRNNSTKTSVRQGVWKTSLLNPSREEEINKVCRTLVELIQSAGLAGAKGSAAGSSIDLMD
jgi:hypothetical protein